MNPHNELQVDDDRIAMSGSAQTGEGEGSTESPPLSQVPGVQPEPVVPLPGDLTDVPTLTDEVDPEAPYGRNKDGTPAKKRGRKGGTAQTDGAKYDRLDSVTPSTPFVRKTQATQARAAITVDYMGLGQTAATLFFGVGTIAFGEDWEPTEKEPIVIAGAFRDYFKSKDIQALDPGLMLVISLTSYALVRVNKPTVKSRIGAAFVWLKNRIPFIGKNKGTYGN